MSGPRRVVVTGIGAVTPLGLTAPATWEAMLAGRSGAAPIRAFDASGFTTTFACELKGFDPLQYMDRKEAKRADQIPGCEAQLNYGCDHRGGQRRDADGQITVRRPPLLPFSRSTFSRPPETHPAAPPSRPSEWKR